MTSKPFFKENKQDLLTKFSERCQQETNFNDQCKKEILCRISFEIDGEQEQLPIYYNTNLDIITDQLLLKIRNSKSSHQQSLLKISEQQRKALKQEIKQKIQVIMESSIDRDKKAQIWKTKLKNIIQNKIKIPLKDSETHHSERNTSRLKGQTSIKYFNYNPFKAQSTVKKSVFDQNSQNKKVQIIYRAKQLENALHNQQKQKSTSTLNHRLYNLSKQNEYERYQISKMREESLQKQLLCECTFHPKIDQYPFRQEKYHLQVQKQQDNPNSVFNRLYRQALEKKQMMKIVERQLKLKQDEQVKQFTFVPKINSCSNQIMKIRKKINQSHGTSIYDHLYHEMYKKQPKQVETSQKIDFHPKISRNSERIVQKKKKQKEKCSLFSKKQVKTYTQQMQNKHKSSKMFTQQSYLSPKQNILKQRQRQSKINELYQIVQKQLTKNKASANKSSRKSNQSRLNNNLKKFKRFQTIHQDSTDNQLLSTKSTRNKDMITMRTECSTKSQKIKKPFENIFTFNNHYSQNKLPAMNKEPSYLISYAETNTQPSLRQIHFNTKSPTHFEQQQNEKQTKKKKRLNPLQFFQLQQKKKENQPKQQTLNTQQSTTTSFQHLSQRQRDHIFSNIFKLLNNKNSEQIDSDCIFYNEVIPIDLKKILFPMAEQMNQLKVGLDQQQFIWSITRICQNLTQIEKNTLINWGISIKL